MIERLPDGHLQPLSRFKSSFGWGVRLARNGVAVAALATWRDGIVSLANWVVAEPSAD
jgi:hypothetical protein